MIRYYKIEKKVSFKKSLVARKKLGKLQLKPSLIADWKIKNLVCLNFVLHKQQQEGKSHPIVFAIFSNILPICT